MAAKISILARKVEFQYNRLSIIRISRPYPDRKGYVLPIGEYLITSRTEQGDNVRVDLEEVLQPAEVK